MSNSQQISSNDWQAESLRFTAFLTPEAKIGEPTWWSELVGEDPEIRISSPKRAVLREEGPFRGGRLVLGIQLLRIDWGLTADQRPEAKAESNPVIGVFSESLRSFIELIGRWLKTETSPPVKRIALGAVLVRPIDNRQSGYKLIARYLPAVKLDTDNSSDFLYRINRPRLSVSSVADLRINRVSTWSVGLWRGAALALEAQSIESVMGPEHHFCRLELDINTASDFTGTLSREKLPEVLQELVSLAEEIAREGDIP